MGILRSKRLGLLYLPTRNSVTSKCLAAPAMFPLALGKCYTLLKLYLFILSVLLFSFLPQISINTCLILAWYKNLKRGSNDEYIKVSMLILLFKINFDIPIY